MFLLAGMARSGTSYTCNLLNQFDKVGCLFERADVLFESSCSLPDQSRIFYPQYLEESLRRNTDDYLTKKERDISKIQIYGIKMPFPDFIYYPLLQMPDLKVIALYRHPLDVFCSIHKRDIDPTDNDWPREIWEYDEDKFKYVAYNNYHNFISKLDRKNVFIVKYEDLVTNDNIIIQILDFLDVKITFNQAKVALNACFNKDERPKGRIDTTYGCIDNQQTQHPRVIKKFREFALSKCNIILKKMKYDLL